MTSPCCNAPLFWTSYNQELWKEVKVDHWTCSECGKPIAALDPAVLTYQKPEQLLFGYDPETRPGDGMRIWSV